MSGYSFKTFDPATGNALSFLPDWVDATISLEFSDVGSLKLTYSDLGKNFSDLNADRVEVGVFYKGVEIDDGRFMVDSNRHDEAVIGDNVEFNGRSLLLLADYCIVYPLSGTSVATAQSFAGQTAGAILRTFFQQNSARGGQFVTITWASFSNTTDSNGVAWGTTIANITYKVGTSYLDVIRNMVDNGLIEVKMVGRDLRVYKAGTMGVDRTTTDPPIVLRRGKDILEAPTTSSSEQIAGVALIEGDSSVLLETSNSTVNAAWGRRETYITQGGISDTTTLGVLSTQETLRRSAVRRQKTRKVDVGASGYEPNVDYRVSDYVFSNTSGANERLRVRQLVIEINQNRVKSASIVLNDKFLEQEIAIARRVSGIIGGATVAGSIGTPTPPAPTVGADTTIPSQVTGVGWTSAAYQNAQGVTLAQITVSWSDVTTNTNSTAIDDLEGYEVQIKRNSTADWGNLGITRSDGSPAYITVPANTTMDVRVRAFDRNGNRGAFSSTITGTTANDSTAPPVPKTPVVVPYLGQIRLYWDGTGSASEAMPTDFKFTEVHMSTTNAFTPSASTLIDQLPAAAYSVATDLTYGTNYYFKLISVDQSGNKSSASAQATAIPERVTGLDVAALTIATSNLGDGAVTTAKIADLTVTTAKIGDAQIVNAKIANLAVDDAKIGSMSVGKLTAGSLTADMTVSARIKTSDTGARVELNSTGLQAYNSSGNQTVAVVASSGAVTIAGSFKTGFSGTRIGIDSTVSTNTISFYPSTGSQVGRITSTEVEGTGAVRIQMFGSQFADPDNAGEIYGARLEVGQLFRLGNYRASNSGDYGGGIYGDRTQMTAAWGNGGDRAGFRAFRDLNRQVRMETGTQDAAESLFTIDKLGNVELFTPGAKFNWDTNSTWNITSMRLPLFQDLGANGWLTGYVSAASGTSWTINYGTTRNPTPVPMITPRFSGGIGWACTTSNNTGFVVTAASTTSGGIHFICYRV